VKQPKVTQIFERFGLLRRRELICARLHKFPRPKWDSGALMPNWHLL
jgi:hypothetical protein